MNFTRVTYLERAAKNDARRKLDSGRFDATIRDFGVDLRSDVPKEVCSQIHNEYKVLCIFTNIMQVSYLFENGKARYNALMAGIAGIQERNSFRETYLNELANVYKKVFRLEYKKLSAIERIEDVNDKVRALKDCVTLRIQYHRWCGAHVSKYDVRSHEHEILVCLFLYERIRDVQALLNAFHTKYAEFQMKAHTERELEKQKILLEIRRERQMINEKEQSKMAEHARKYDDDEWEDLTRGTAETSDFSEYGFNRVDGPSRRQGRR